MSLQNPPHARFTSRESPVSTTRQAELDDAAIHDVHDFYLIHIVEELNICPFARKSRELGHVARELIRGETRAWQASTAAARLRERAAQPWLWEIVLFTFPLTGDDDPLADLAAFEALHRDFRAHLAQPPAVDHAYFSVCFHPSQGASTDTAHAPAAFVQELRRSPDPVIQCVHVQTLENIRRHAQTHAMARMKRELQAAALGLPPALSKLVESAVLTDCELSSDIAAQNFDRYCRGPERARFEAALAELAALRKASRTPHDVEEG